VSFHEFPEEISVQVAFNSGASFGIGNPEDAVLFENTQCTGDSPLQLGLVPDKKMDKIQGARRLDSHYFSALWKLIQKRKPRPGAEEQEWMGSKEIEGGVYRKAEF
jgi:hypothetical protein